MDPLSALTSIVTLTGAVAKSLNGLEEILGASTELHALINETSDLQVVLKSVQTALRDSQDHDAVGGLSGTLDRTNNQLLEVEKLINYRLIRLGARGKNGLAKVDHRRWLQNISYIKKLQQSLRDSRQNLTIGLVNLTVGLTSNNASRLSRIELKLQEISVQVTAPKRGMFPVQAQITDSLAKNNPDLGSSSPLPSQAMPPVPARSINEENLGKLTNLLQGNYRDSTGPETRKYEGEPIRESSATSIRISASLSQDRNSCRAWCGCACHVQSKLHTPEILKPLLGRLFIGYTGIPLIRQQCDQSSCRRHRSKAVKVSYYFPSWFFARILSLSIVLMPSDGPHISLTFPRIVSKDAIVFRFAEIGDVGGIKTLFREGTASPRDILSVGGYTPLHVRRLIPEALSMSNTHRKHRLRYFTIKWRSVDFF